MSKRKEVPCIRTSLMMYTYYLTNLSQAYMALQAQQDNSRRLEREVQAGEDHAAEVAAARAAADRAAWAANAECAPASMPRPVTSPHCMSRSVCPPHTSLLHTASMQVTADINRSGSLFRGI